MCFVICSRLPLQLRNKGKGDSLQPPICTSSLTETNISMLMSVSLSVLTMLNIWGKPNATETIGNPYEGLRGYR